MGDLLTNDEVNLLNAQVIKRNLGDLIHLSSELTNLTIKTSNQLVEFQKELSILFNKKNEIRSQIESKEEVLKTAKGRIKKNLEREIRGLKAQKDKITDEIGLLEDKRTELSNYQDKAHLRLANALARAQKKYGRD